METARYALGAPFALLLLMCGVARAAPEPDHDVLIKAINFALTGRDGITYSFTDREGCVVSWAHDSAEPGIQAIETFHLNNVDASRISFNKMQSRAKFGVEYFIRVELYGESVIRENGFRPSVTAALALNDVPLDLQTTEMDRLTRAWKHIYSHGCKSGHSSF